MNTRKTQADSEPFKRLCCVKNLADNILKYYSLEVQKEYFQIKSSKTKEIRA